MKYPRINGKQLSAKDKLKFEYIKNCIEESIDFDSDSQLLGLDDKQIKLLSYNAAFNVLSGMNKDFSHLL